MDTTNMPELISVRVGLVVVFSLSVFGYASAPQYCDPPFTASLTLTFKREVCRAGQGYTIVRADSETFLLRCYCQDGSDLKCVSDHPHIEYHVDNDDKNVFHVTVNETYLFETLPNGEEGTCTVVIHGLSLPAKETTYTTRPVETSASPAAPDNVCEDNQANYIAAVVFLVIFLLTGVGLGCLAFKYRRENQGLKVKIAELQNGTSRSARVAYTDHDSTRPSPSVNDPWAQAVHGGSQHPTSIVPVSPDNETDITLEDEENDEANSLTDSNAQAIVVKVRN